MEGQSTEITEEPSLRSNAEVSEHSSLSPNLTDNTHDNLDSAIENHGDMEVKHEIAEEVRSILEVIAATGKFWHDWEKLKSMLSIYLKQVISEYSEAKMTSDQQISTLGETYLELEKRLDDALQTFVEGPPFTLQRLSEIILNAQSMYPNLSKLALALEKNLLVTSTLSICTDPYPSAMVKIPTEPVVNTQPPSLSVHEPVANGAETVTTNMDEVVSEVEAEAADQMEAEAADQMAMDIETFKEIVRSSETGSMPAGDS